MTPAQNLGLSQKAYDVYRILWGDSRATLTISKAHAMYCAADGGIEVSSEEMPDVLRELKDAHFLIPLKSRTTGERQYTRTASGRLPWSDVHGE